MFPACFTSVSIAPRAELASLARALRSLHALFYQKLINALSCHLSWLVFPACFYAHGNRFARRARFARSRAALAQRSRKMSLYFVVCGALNMRFRSISMQNPLIFGPQNALKSVPKTLLEPLPYGFYLGAAKRALILGFYVDVC